MDELTHQFVTAVGRRAIVRVQGPVQLSNISEPQPDIMLLNPRSDGYRQGQATGPDSLLVVEVSASSLRYDLTFKRALYGRHGVPEVWVVEVEAGRLHCFRDLRDGAYADNFQLQAIGPIPVPGVDGAIVDLSRLFNV